MNVFHFEYFDGLGFSLRPDLVLNIWLYSLAGLILMPLGMLFANYLRAHKPERSVRLFAKTPIAISRSDSSPLMVALISGGLIIALVVLLLYRQAIGEFPILQVKQGLSSLELQELRSNTTNNFQGSYWRYAVFMKYFPLTLLVFTYFCINAKPIFKILFACFVAFTSFVAVIDFQKAPLIYILVLLTLAHWHKQRSINKSTLIGLGTLGVISIPLMYISFMAVTDRNFWELLLLPISRIFLGGIAPFFFWQLFQEHGGYVYGASLPNPGGLLPYETRAITVEVERFTFSRTGSTEVVGSMPTVYFGEWFLNFGPWAALISMLVFGCLLQLVDIYFQGRLNRKKTPLLSCMYVYIILYFLQFTGTNLSRLLFAMDLFVPAFLLFLLHQLTRRRKETQIGQNYLRPPQVSNY